MRIKKFTGTTLKEATDAMRGTLGEDAIILSTRRVPKGGLLNFLAKDGFEITAAVDEQPVTRSGAFAKQLSRAAGERSGGEATTLDSLQKVAAAFEQKGRGQFRGGEGVAHHSTGMTELKQEVENLRTVVQEMASHIKYAKMPSLPEYLKHAYTTLVQQDVNDQLAAEITQQVYRKLGEDKLASKQAVEQAILHEIASLFAPVPGRDRQVKRTKVVALVGPTGVGKTTTIAKLAAIHKLMHKQQVALISADTYRIGAIEQLRTFASIADIPMEVVYKPAEIKSALAEYRTKDIVFIDTVGRSQRVKKEISELARFISASNAHEVHLVLSAAASDRTVNEAVTNFKPLAPNRIIFSKLDESGAYGLLLNTAVRHKLPVSFVTTGQNVPDDIREAQPASLAELVYKGVLMNA